MNSVDVVSDLLVVFRHDDRCRTFARKNRNPDHEDGYYVGPSSPEPTIIFA